MKNTINHIKENKIVAIVRGVTFDKMIPMAEALQAGGIKLLEVTFNQSSATGEEDTASAIKLLSNHFGDSMLIGAGTVMNEHQVKIAVDAGAKYIISPNTDFSVIKKTKELAAVSIPGALTPSEIVNAYEAGAHFVKLFPAADFGIKYIKSVLAPLSHIPLLGVGGVNDENLMDFINIGLKGVGVGSNIVNKKLINEGKFDELTKLAKKYTSQI